MHLKTQILCNDEVDINNGIFRPLQNIEYTLNYSYQRKKYMIIMKLCTSQIIK